MRAWHSWYHVSGHTYGSWLRGDPRGWRARHHREHVDGDYKNPPAKGMYDAIHARSKRLMERQPVTLPPGARRIACDLFAEALTFHRLDPLAISVDGRHYHVLARFRDKRPRHWIGIAKNRSARALSDAGLVPRGGVWAVRCKCLPINDRPHQVTVFKHILKHGRKGAAVWRFDGRREPRMPDNK